MPSTTIRIGPPFGGLDRRTSPRVLGKAMAADCRNVLVSRGALTAREPVRNYLSKTTWTDQPAPGPATLIAAGLFERYMWAPGKLEHYLHLIWHDQVDAYQTLIDKNGSAATASLGALPVLEYGGDTQIVAAENASFFIHTESGKPMMKAVDTGGAALITREVGIAAPAAAPTLTIIAGTFAANSTISYRVTYRDSVCGVESGPSAAATATSGAPFGVQVGWPQSGDAHVDQACIYRRDTAIDDTWYFVATSPVLTAYGDTGWAITKYFDEQVSLGVGVPPKSRCACWHKNRMWYAPADDEGTIVHSEYNKPENVNPASGYAVGGADGQSCRMMFSAGGYMFILRSGSIWALSGDGPDTFAVSEIEAEVGCIAPRSVVQVGSRGVLFAGKRGIYRLSKNGAELIGGPLGDSWYHLDIHSKAALLQGVHYEKYGLVLWRWGTMVLAYDYTQGTWASWRIPELSELIELFDSWTNLVIVPGVFRMDPVDQGLGELCWLRMEGDGLDYGDDPIEWYWETGDLDLGIGRMKRFDQIRLGWATGVSTASLVTIKFRVDQEAAWTAGPTVNLKDQNSCKLDVGRVGETIAVRLEGQGAREVELGSLEIDAEPLGVVA